MSSYHDCYACNGTGIDDADWSGRCFACGGSGMSVDDDDERPPDSDADPAFILDGP